jgi:hypothetical protein
MTHPNSTITVETLRHVSGTTTTKVITSEVRSGIKVEVGVKGLKGTGITSAAIVDGNLHLTYSNGAVVDVGRVASSTQLELQPVFDAISAVQEITRVKTQSFSSATQWQVLHNLGKIVTVKVYDEFGSEVIAEVQHTSLNEFLVKFGSPQVGSVSYF